MKLTQRQLALLARVSTPTVSRFEQAAKDIQLSSALAILEALGMTDKRTLVFQETQSRYDSGRGAFFQGMDGSTTIDCWISLEALRFHFSDGGRLDHPDAFKKHRAEIEALARRKYLLGKQEADGTVLIKTEDVA
jgi:transcriptional regulator with XRE-family HTH domain